jgi:hypothetical protein
MRASSGNFRAKSAKQDAKTAASFSAGEKEVDEGTALAPGWLDYGEWF